MNRRLWRLKYFYGKCTPMLASSAIKVIAYFNLKNERSIDCHAISDPTVSEDQTSSDNSSINSS